MIRVFLSFTELGFRAIEPITYFVALVFTGLLGSLGLNSKSVSPALGAVVLQLSAYALPAFFAWLILRFVRARQRLPTPLPGRHWLTAGLACTGAGHVLRFALAGKGTPSFFFTLLHWASLATIPLLVVGLVLAVCAMKPRTGALEASKSVAQRPRTSG